MIGAMRKHQRQKKAKLVAFPSDSSGPNAAKNIGPVDTVTADRQQKRADQTIRNLISN